MQRPLIHPIALCVCLTSACGAASSGSASSGSDAKHAVAQPRSASAASANSAAPRTRLPNPSPTPEGQGSGAPDSSLVETSEPRSTAVAEAESSADLDARDRASIDTLKAARAQYEAFIQRAGADPAYAEAVERSRARMKDIEHTIDFIQSGIDERRAAAR